MSIPSDTRASLKDIDAPGALWLDGVPEEYKQMVGMMISEDPSQRPTASQLLMSPFLSQFR